MSAVRKAQTEARPGQKALDSGLRRNDGVVGPSRSTRVVIEPERCKGCGICAAFCPVGMLAVGDTLNPHGYPVVRLAEGKECRGCGRCYVMCPDLVFTLYPGEDGP